MNFFKCKHPFKCLAVEKEHTEIPDSKYPNDFNMVTYHLFCRRCKERVDLTHAKILRGPASIFKMIEDFR